MKVTGKLHVIMDEQVISDKFKKRECVILDESSQFPQHILVQFVQDRTSLLDGKKVGDEVSVSINIKGREWTSPEGVVKYFNTIEGWKVEDGAGETAMSANLPIGDEDQDSLPF